MAHKNRPLSSALNLSPVLNHLPLSPSTPFGLLSSNSITTKVSLVAFSLPQYPNVTLGPRIHNSPGSLYSASSTCVTADGVEEVEKERTIRASIPERRMPVIPGNGSMVEVEKMLGIVVWMHVIVCSGVQSVRSYERNDENKSIYAFGHPVC